MRMPIVVSIQSFVSEIPYFLDYKLSCFVEASFENLKLKCRLKCSIKNIPKILYNPLRNQVE